MNNIEVFDYFFRRFIEIHYRIIGRGGEQYTLTKVLCIKKKKKKTVITNTLFLQLL